MNWTKQSKPIIGLSPMDGITDAAFRHVLIKHSKPDIIYTEFTNVEGLARGAVEMLKSFIYEEGERPIVAQLFGTEISSFYKATVLMAFMGFDGIDINMGCPVKKMAKLGAGAYLIKTPELAGKIIKSCQKALKDFKDGITPEEVGISKEMTKEAKKIRSKACKTLKPTCARIIPLSVKTRIGFDCNIAMDWAKFLSEFNLSAICMHGRTLKQMYTGKADWEVLGEVASYFKKTETLFLGNGDVENLLDAKSKIENHTPDGVLIGRAGMGNPWLFSNHIPTVTDRLNALVYHAGVFEKTLPNVPFIIFRKHIASYISGFKNAKELRVELMNATDSLQIQKIINNFQKSY